MMDLVGTTLASPNSWDYTCKCSGSQNPKLISPVSIADALLIGSVPLSQGRDMKRQLDQWWNAVFAIKI